MSAASASAQRATGGWRITPHRPLGRSVRLVERNLRAMRRGWTLFVSGLFEPMFYLFALGVGVGGLVGEVVGPEGELIPYGVFVAPALLAASAMNGGTYESTINVFAKLKWGKVYDAVLTSPVTPREIAVGELIWALMRGWVYAVSFLVISAVLGLVPSWWGLLALPAASLIGFCFAGLGLMVTTFLRSWQDFDLIELVLLPLFLFSATFYPLEVYPEAVRWIAQVSPLYHGVELVRGVMTGSLSWALLGNVAVLAALGSIGLSVAVRRFGRLLRS